MNKTKFLEGNGYYHVEYEIPPTIYNNVFRVENGMPCGFERFGPTAKVREARKIINCPESPLALEILGLIMARVKEMARHYDNKANEAYKHGFEKEGHYMRDFAYKLHFEVDHIMTFLKENSGEV